MKRGCLLIATLMMAAAVMAEDGSDALGQSDDAPPSTAGGRYYTGLSVFVDASGLWADRVTADFYSGRPENANTINRVLHSNFYGQQIWYNLVNQGLISPSAISSYEQLEVVEYARMYYATSYQIGLGLRYDYNGGWGWLLRFDLGRLEALGAFNISSNNGTGILNNGRQYIRCGIMGKEDRINIDLGLSKIFALTSTLDMEFNVGFNVNNTKVKENMMEVGGSTYSILDIWGGRTPNRNVGSYEYINQGGIGIGGFASALLGYQVKGVGAIKVGYTCYRTTTKLEGYSAMGWSHLVGIRLEMYNFSFI